MRKWLLLVWLMIPVLAGAYHYGPGQEQMVLDRAARILALADRCAADQQWLEAEQQYEQALQLLPADQIDQQRRVRLERSKAQLFIAKLPIAHRELKQLVDELQDDPETDSTLLDDARSTLANSQYYLTWLMRLEGQPRKAWEPEIEAARQTFRLLAEQADGSQDATGAQRNREDLEATIRLARMDLGDLQGLPLPTQ